jgi:RNA polymerase sigma factor (sigma-70 family)
MSAMASDDPSSLHTRPSLLERLKSSDPAGWDDFYRIYGKLVRDFAVHAGLTDAESDDAVQETMVAIARHLPQYHYDPTVCRFKTWLLNQTSWRIKDQLKKRRKEAAWSGLHTYGSERSGSSDDTSTATINRVPDPAQVDLDALFEAQWRKTQFAIALDRVKGKFSLKQFQIFDLLVVKEWPAVEVAKALGVSVTNAYVTRHRISAAVKKETKRIEQQLEQAARNRMP